MKFTKQSYLAYCSLTLIFCFIINVVGSVDYASAVTKCKTGKKLGKTPISLVVGAKPSCYDIKLAALAKKMLTTDSSKSCKMCHAASSTLYPNARVGKMNANMRDQGYTLKPAQITASFAAHASEMMGATMKSSDAKAISHYLQSIK